MTGQITPREAAEGARGAFATGRTRSVAWREAQLRGIERMCDEREDEICSALTADLGRPAFEGWLADIGSTRAEAVYARKNLRKWMRTKLLNSGQTCIAPDYVLAERTIAGALTDTIIATLAAFRVDEPETSVPIVNERQFDRLAGLIAGTGGNVVAGGGVDRTGLRIEPTVILDPPLGDPVMNDEIFGPILPIITVGSAEEAVTVVNSRPKPLAALRLHQLRAARPRPRRPNALRGSGDQPHRDALPRSAIAVRWRWSQRNGCLPRQMGVRNAQPPPRAVLATPAKPDPGLLYPPYSLRAMKVIRRLLRL